jgi:tRNA G18 (ribose-2'-O)-methylase SpoU
MRNPIYVILDNVRSLYNVGAIFRTSDAANIKKIYLGGITGYPKDDPNWFETKKIEKTALGANKTVPWQHVKNIKSKVESLKSKGVKIYVLENTSTSTPYTSTPYTFPCALVLGHEVKGVSQEIIDLADEVISIPMYGKKTSLNVEAAYAIAVYEILRQKNRPKIAS